MSYPGGTVSSLAYVRFRGAGKQWDLEPPYREPPLVLHTGLASLEMKGVVVTEPLTGKFFTCTKIKDGFKGASGDECSTAATSITITDGLFVGTNMDFKPAPGRTVAVERSLFFGGQECRTDCPPHKM